MVIFLALFIKLLPLYGIVLLGWFAGKHLDVEKESIAPLVIYIVSPIVIFNGVITIPLNTSTLSLPVLFFILACAMCTVFYFIGKLFWSGSEKNILAFTSGDGNTGYFGLPVVLALFGEQYLGIAVLLTVGFLVYENSLGFYIAARGQYSAKNALMKVVKLPTLYAFLLGIIVNIWHIPIAPTLMEVIVSFRGAYVVLGMMMIGLGLAHVTKASLDYLFTGIAFFAKFVTWPIIVALIIFLDMKFLHLYSSEIYKIMLLISIVPLASNTVAYATRLNTYPEKAALTVLLSTVFAIIYIPLFIALFFPLL